MPSVPMAMPSLMVGVPNTCGVAAGRLHALDRRVGQLLQAELQGVMVLWPLATPIIGLPKSPSV
jgi:hypothetical protein